MCQQRSRVIVMLSELDPKKCAYYWPKEGETLRFPKDDTGSEISVVLVESKPNKAWFVAIDGCVSDLWLGSSARSLYKSMIGVCFL